MQFQPLDISDFSGGITDNVIGREKSKYSKAHNFIITVDKKLSIRPGSTIDGATDTLGKISQGVEYLLAPFLTTEKPFKLTTNSTLGKFIYFDGATHQELLGPKASAGNFTVTIASPAVLTKAAHALRNGDSVTLSTTGALPTGLSVATTYYVIARAVNTFQLSATLGGAAINTSGAQSGTHTVTPLGNSLFTVSHGGATDHRFSAASWNNHSYITSSSFTEKVAKVYEDASAVLTLRTAGLPKYAGSDPTVTASGPGTGATVSYLIALVFKYTYTVGGQTFVTRSAPYRTTATGKADDTIASITVPANGALANNSADNYGTADVTSLGGPRLELEYYRSIQNGSEYYFIGLQTNATIDGIVTIADTLYNADVLLRPVIYTSGGVADNDPPPKCKFMHITERGTAYYGYCQDSSDTIQTRIRQSKVGVPDACPVRFFDDMDEAVTGISSYRGTPLFFTKNNVYRGDGVFDSFGQGNLTASKISNFAGAVSHNGIVQTYFGCFFPGDSGFYWTNGYEVTKISEELPTSYATAYPTDTLKSNIVGTYDPVNQLIYWTYADSANSDACFVLHLRFGIKPDSVFTTIGGNITTAITDATVKPSTVPTTISQNFRAKSMLYFNGLIYRADSRGYVMYFDSTKKSDPRVVTSANISTWGSTYIYYNWTSAALDFGNALLRKWTPAVLTVLKNVGNLSLQIKQDRDLLGNYRNLKEMKQTSSVTWAQAGVLWGDPALYSSDASLYEEKRMLNTPGVRCDYRTLKYTNAFTVIQKSDNIGLATVDSAAKTATLINAGEVWPSDILDYYITFLYDNYVNHFLITSNTSTAITFSDATNSCPINGNYKWEIRGYSKTDSIFIQSVVMPFAYLSDSQLGYRSGVEGGNA